MNHAHPPSSSERDLDELVAELDEKYNGTLPREALREAQRRREEITPRLIELIRHATQAVRNGEEIDRNGQLFALFLLTEFEATEALPAILEAVSLPGEGPFDLFGDTITEDFCGLLAALTGDSPEVVDELIADRSLSEYVRWAAARTFLNWVRDGRMTRDEAVERLRSHLREAMKHQDGMGVTGIVCELLSFCPEEALDEIRTAFRSGLVEEGMVTMEFIMETIAEGDRAVQRSLKHCPPTGVEDTVAELSRWASFQEPARSRFATAGDSPKDPSRAADGLWDDGVDVAPRSAASAPIRADGPKVGRNEPCPCGSGKKYKKCCGAAR